GADGKLVTLARTLGVPIMTNDYGLNRVAELQGITVLNINDLAKAVRPVVLPGEEITVRVIQEGKEPAQAVGYLEDGTMVVVENGARHIGSELAATVMRVLQTVTASSAPICLAPLSDRKSTRLNSSHVSITYG